MRVMVTGATGFVGRTLLEALSAEGHTPVACIRRPPPEDFPPVACVQADLCDEAAVARAVAEAQPEALVHLAGMTYLPEVAAAPTASFAVNVLGTDALLRAVGQHAPGIRALIVSSCCVYGAPDAAHLPLSEEAPLAANHPYGVQKIGLEVLAQRAHAQGWIDGVVARPFNHLGPGQDPRISALHFARQIVAVERGQAEFIGVGNLEPRRDICDVRDTVRAYLALLELDAPPPIVNVCSGRSLPISAVLEVLIARARTPVEVRPDPERQRPSDVMDLVGDPTLLRDATGWEPRHDLNDTFERLLGEARGEWRGVRW